LNVPFNVVVTAPQKKYSVCKVSPLYIETCSDGSILWTDSKKKKNQLRFHVSDVEESYPGRADMKVVIIKLGLYNNITPAREDI